MKPPWWFCTGWRSPWCVIDIIVHEMFKISMPCDDDDNPAHCDHWICRRHDAAVNKYFSRRFRRVDTGEQK